MDKLKLHSKDLTAENIEKLAALFPNCLTETKAEDGSLKHAIDFDLLRQELSADLVEGPQERYRLDWPGKREALATANAPIAKTLRPCREESVEFDSTKNLYIEGDNLEALKLLQETYLGKVKMIYIDPPYNTGKEFIYHDDFKESAKGFSHRSNQVDDEGNQLIANPEYSGRFHSDWLSMIQPRIKLARNLLADDGVVFVSIDDGESANLKRVLDETFGEQNFIDTIAVEMSTTSGPKTVNAQQGTIVKNVEFVHVYTKSTEFDSAKHIPLLDGIDSYDTHYSNWLNDDGTLSQLSEKLLSEFSIARDIELYSLLERKKFSLKKMDTLLSLSEAARSFINDNLHRIARVDRPPVSARNEKPAIGRWEKFEVEHRTYMLTTLENGTLQALMPLSLNYRTSDDYKPRFGRTVIRGDLWKGFHQDMGNVAKEGDVQFANGKKPLRLIKQLMKWANYSDDAIVLDFFSGSATTAHAVLELNTEDGGSRRHIMVQLPEDLEKSLEASTGKAKSAMQAAMKLLKGLSLPLKLSEIGKERIRRAGAKIRAELEAQLEGELPESDKHQEITAKLANLDTGFRVLKIDSSNMADVYYRPDEVTQEGLDLQVENIKPDRSPEDLLFQVLLDWGVDLALPIEQENIDGKTVFFVDNNALAACFDTGLDEDFVKTLAKRQPLRAVFRDASFASDATRINIEQIFKALSPHTELKSI